ncbi:mycofactocin system transcriptional regulator [Fodinibacter luteus]|uniref:Mycofactocin system transcriptional regulator n=1 Tax=Fodinibacter luteus TaxID=552064 RepID=A0ABP8K2K3_9MICO
MAARSPLPSDGCSLRSRKRAETHSMLAGAAYSLVRDVGFDAVTAEAVADRAGVSRRTFFNYFPSVESVLTASIAEFFVSVGERLEARPAGEDVLDSALAVVSDPGDVELVERIAVIAAAGESSPHARGLILVEVHAWLDWLEDWLRQRLPPGSGDLFVATYASTLVGAAEAAFRVWARGARDGGAADHPSLRAALAVTLGHLRTGLDSGRP